VALGGCGGLLLVIALALLTGTDPLQLLQSVQESQTPIDRGPTLPPSGSAAPEDELSQFVSVVLADTEDT
jgi:predicted metalloprotease